MQFINNQMSGYGALPPNNRRKSILIIGGILLIVGLGLLIFNGVRDDRQSREDVTRNEYFDAASGETVSNPEGKSPEIFGDASKQIVFLGFSKLTNYGITEYHQDAAKLAFKLYSGQRSEKINEVSVFVDTIKRIPVSEDNPDRTHKITFDVKINRKDTMQATLQYVSIRSAQLILVQNNSEVYRSEMIDPDDFTEDGEDARDYTIPPEDR